jgi:hypothetical protein
MEMQAIADQTATLAPRIAEFVAKADEISAKYWEQQGYTHSPPPKHRADMLSEKWCRVVTVEDRNGVPTDSSVFAFICLQDGFTKALGKLKAGDVHKAARFKAPAATSSRKTSPTVSLRSASST